MVKNGNIVKVNDLYSFSLNVRHTQIVFLLTENIIPFKTKSWDFPGGSDGKEIASSTRDPGSIPGLGRSSGEGKDYPLWYSCLEKSMDMGAWRGYGPWGLKELDFHFP